MQTGQIDTLDISKTNEATKQDLISAVQQGSEDADDDDSEKVEETKELKKASSKVVDKKDKDDDSEENASALAEEDLNVPKWPKYADPTSQQEEIKTELVEV